MAAREILYETFFTKAPGQEKLRKTAEGRLRYLIRDGWHEMERQQIGPDSVRVRFEREGVTKPLEPLRKKPEPPPRRRPREGRGGGRGSGAPRSGAPRSGAPRSGAPRSGAPRSGPGGPPSGGGG